MLHRWLNAVVLLPDPRCYQTPADLGLVAEAVAFPNAAGQLLRGLWCAPCPQTAAPAPVVVFCPGTSGNLSSHLQYVALLCRAGCQVLGLDYTGFGASAGEPSLHTLVSDVQCALDFLQRDKQVTSYSLFGISLGANLALQVAAERPEVRAVAVEGLAIYSEITYGVMRDGIMGPRRITSLAYADDPPVPRQHHVVNARLVPAWMARLLARLGTIVFPFAGKEPRRAASQLCNTPVLCIHGLEDRLLSFEGTMQVYDALAGPRSLWLIPAVSHPQEAALAVDGEYVAQLAHFFHTALQGESTPTLTWQLILDGPQQYRLRLHTTEPPGVVLLTMATPQTLTSRTLWLDTAAEIALPATDAPPWVHALRLRTGCKTGEGLEPDLTPRGVRYRQTWQPLIRALTQALHERRAPDYAALVQAMPAERPEPPFDFFLGLYCIQIMQRTQHTMPQVAYAAAQRFRQYWHYGPPPEVEGPTPWDLAAAILGAPMTRPVAVGG